MLLGGFWLLVLSWLAICLAVQGYYAWAWLVDSTNPYRNEARIGIAMAFSYALPALAGVGLLRWRFWELSSQATRTTARALITALLTLAFLGFV